MTEEQEAYLRDISSDVVDLKNKEQDHALALASHLARHIKSTTELCRPIVAEFFARLRADGGKCWYRGWDVSYKPERPVTGKWRAERFGVGMCANTREMIIRMIDRREKDREKGHECICGFNTTNEKEWDEHECRFTSGKPV